MRLRWTYCITLAAVGWVAFELFRFHQEPNEVATIDAAKRSMRTPIIQWVAVCGVAFVMNLAFGTDGFWAWTVWIGAAAWPATVYVRRMLVDRGKFLHPKLEAEPAAAAAAVAGACA